MRAMRLAGMVATLLAGASAPALAGYGIEEETVPPPAPVVSSQPLAQDLGLAYGFGDSVPLQLAVRQIVPQSLSVVFAPEINQTALVSWSGGRAWGIVLSDVLMARGLDYERDGNVVRVRRSTAPAAASPLDLLSEAARQQQATTVPANEAVKSVAEKPREAAPTGAWMVEPGMTLLDTVDKWAAQAGWKTYRKPGTPDYTLNIAATFYGGFEKAASALLRQFKSAQKPIGATFYSENQSIEIGPRAKIDGGL